MFRQFFIKRYSRVFEHSKRVFAGSSQYSTYRTFNNHHGRVTNLQGVWERHWKAISITGAGVTIYVGTHLERTPVSDRLRFMIISKEYENKVGEQGYQQVLQEYRNNLLPDYHPAVKRVKRVMERLIKVSGLEAEHLDWRVHVVDDPKAPPNAFVLPSGKVFVFTSILPIAENDDGLATVLSHETAHVLLRHSAETLSQAPFLMIADLILSVIFNINVNNLTTLLFQLPASRTHESEADYVGLMMMAKACYNTSEAVQFWLRMGQTEKQVAGGLGGKIPELLSTHPATKRRVENMEEWLPEARQESEKMGCADGVRNAISGFSSVFKGFS